MSGRQSQGTHLSTVWTTIRVSLFFFEIFCSAQTRNGLWGTAVSRDNVQIVSLDFGSDIFLCGVSVSVLRCYPNEPVAGLREESGVFPSDPHRLLS